MKLPPSFTRAPQSTPADKDEFALMLQSLLEERLQMKAHQEDREMPVYELVVAKGGPKLEERSEPAPEPPPGPVLDQAVQDQLGLKLQPKKGIVDTVVIDRIEKTPIEN